MHVRTLLTSALLLSCASEQNHAMNTPTPEPELAQAELEEGPARARLAQRLDDTGFALGPLENVAQALEFDAASVLDGLSRVTGEAFEAEASGVAWRATSASYSAEFDAARGQFAVTGTREYQRGLPVAADELFSERTLTLLSGIASDVADHALDLKHLGATTRELGEQVGESDVRVGSKVFVVRRLGGLRVAGNRLVASFATDGTLVGVRGLWPSIDLAHSRLSSSLGLDEARERALDLLLLDGVNPEHDEPIVLESFYRLDVSEHGVVASLRGAALVTSYNNDGLPGRRERHEFDL